MAGIYIHIPFCRHACSYCNFYFSTRRDQINDFTKALLRQIQQSDFNELLGSDEFIETIYFGGGTPSLLSLKKVEDIFETLSKKVDLSNVKEWTFELNPENASLNYLESLRSIGVNRLSMGVQSFQPRLLKHMHRSHTKAEAIRAIENIHTAGFKSFNTDLIYAYPTEHIDELEDDLRQFIQMESPHISAYSLTIEENTRLNTLINKGKLEPVLDANQAEHFDRVQSVLEGAGLSQYEVSNYAKEGHESKHNSSYWSHVNYLGFGPAAHSFLWSQNGEFATRWRTAEDLSAYISQNGHMPKVEMVELSLQELVEERIMLGFRTQKGLDIRELRGTYKWELGKKQANLLKEWESKGIIKNSYSSAEKIQLSPKSLQIADYLVYKFITA